MFSVSRLFIQSTCVFVEEENNNDYGMHHAWQWLFSIQYY